jgi:hypothetical protein
MNSKMTVSKELPKRRKRQPMTEAAKTKMLEKRKITIETKRLHETFNPDSELHRKIVFTFLFNTQKKQGESNAWMLLPELTELINNKNFAEKYIIEYITQYETIKAKYISEVEVYGDLHYKTLSKMLLNFYSKQSGQ